MSFQTFGLPADISTYGITAAVALIVVAKLSQPSKLDAIPTVGSNSWLSSCWAGLKFVINAKDLLQEGYNKHKSAPFKVAGLYRWVVIISNPRHVEEIRAAPEDVLSVQAAVDDLLQTDYTMGPRVRTNPYHTSILRSRLTRNIGVLYPEIRDEIATAFDDVLDLRGNDWKIVPTLDIVEQVVCRMSNRAFVGLPLCRNPDWIDLNIKYTLDVVKGAMVISLFPDLLKPIAAWLFTNVYECERRATKLLGPIIEERKGYLNEYGDDWADKPNDFLSWLMEEAEGTESTAESLTTRILVINFSAIHTTAKSFAHALLYLAANPQYIKPLREEVETNVGKDGWSKAALGKLRKVDSFLKECQRFEGISLSVMRRRVVKDVTFSDGTVVPKGALIVVDARSIHRDETFYENARLFEPFRFADLHEADEENAKHQFVSTTTEYLPFGHGRHACPGRFFAANGMKSMLAHILVTYDVKLADNTTLPPSLHIEMGVTPDPSAKVVFRRRAD